MKKIILGISTLILLVSPIPNNAEAFTRADIDLLVSLDLIENKSLIPLLYLLASDTPAPDSEDEKENSDSKSEKEDEEDNEKVSTKKSASNIVTSAYTEKINQLSTEERGIYTIELSLTAIGEDSWIEDSVGLSGAGFHYEVIGEKTYSGTQNAFISETSASKKENGRYKISEDQTESFLIQIELNPDSNSEGEIWGIQLTKITFAKESSGSGAFTYQLSDKGELQTKKVIID